MLQPCQKAPKNLITAKPDRKRGNAYLFQPASRALLHTASVLKSTDKLFPGGCPSDARLFELPLFADAMSAICAKTLDSLPALP
jgi:hypothetical protein